MPETLKTLLEKREILMNRADSLRKTDPRMADYLDKLGNNMDGELEGTEPMQDRDEQGFLQGEDPDYRAWNAAGARVRGERSTEDATDPLAVSPTFLAAVNQHLSEQMRQNWQAQLQHPNPSNPGVMNNSVTPWARPTQDQGMALINSLKAPTQSPVLALLQRLAQSGVPDEY